jgi:serine/threonine protein kinase
MNRPTPVPGPLALPADTPASRRPSSPAEFALMLPDPVPPGPSQTPLPAPRPGPRPPDPTAAWPEAGAVLGKYRLLDLVGRGTSSLVYKAEHIKLPLTVAIKVLRLDHVTDPAPLLNQLASEAAVLAHLNHPHIIRVYDFEDEGPFPYLVTEYVRGCSLNRLIREHGRLPQDGALQVLSRLADALATAQQLGIVHRDIKPDNILLTKSGEVKLADLGLAVAVGNRILPGVLAAQGQGGVTGTAAYLAPEQALRPHEVDHRADIYGLGATFYHALCGRLPFEGRSCMEVLYKHLREPVVPPLTLVPDLDPEVSDLLMKMLAKEPRDRFATYAELRAATTAIRTRRQARKQAGQ